ncbi:F-box only protein 8 isoform X2 [Nycticebus coucang]|uniref:F-box only protein 8 isoform X2 n=1 Tax=Nycticebus coucang TaxID=9470 RepID=UPI00234C5C1F|nr:F-box only protein 8 isoform X2 [Nycticebus coucang]
MQLTSAWLHVFGRTLLTMNFSGKGCANPLGVTVPYTIRTHLWGFLLGNCICSWMKAASPLMPTQMSHREQDSPKDTVHVPDVGNQTPQRLLAVAHGVGENFCAAVGVNYFMSKGILDDSPKEIAKFIFCTRTLNWKKLRIYLDERRDVLDDLVTLHNFRNQFLPNALREFFRHIHAPEERGEYLETLITKFSHRFCACNPDLMRELGLSPDGVYVLCYSLILLSIDLSSPHVKNKMSKREFIRNTRRAAQNISEDFVGHLYDNIYLIGHVAA